MLVIWLYTDVFIVDLYASFGALLIVLKLYEALLSGLKC